MTSKHPKVLISYSHDSTLHKERVLALAQRLRSEGVVAQIDQYVPGTPPEGWARWMLDQIDWADFVLLVCTETYYRRFRGHENPAKGRGVDFEGNLITASIYQARSRTAKFVPVFFDQQDEQFIPEPLSAHTHYRLSLNETHCEDDYTKLYAFLTGRAGVPAGDVGPLKPLAGKQAKSVAFGVLGTLARPVRKIFISSPAKDLGESCATLARAIDAHEGWHCIRMEESDAVSIEHCQKRVQECHVYVGIIGAFYGSCPLGSKISFAQHEYEAAVTNGMPRLIFLTSEDFRVPVDLSETYSDTELQQNFRYRIKQDPTARSFDNFEDLKVDVIRSLSALLEHTVDELRVTPRELNVEPQFGLKAYRLCDRGPQEDAFTSFFRQNVQKVTCVPHIYILRGEECENLDSLIDRFCTVTLEKHLISQLDLPRAPVTCRLVEWPDPDSPYPEEALARRLFAKVAEDEPYPALDPPTFVNLRLLSRGGMLAVKHEIREKRWSEKRLRLIDWYCRFWDEVAAHSPRRRILVFLSILYPDGTKEHGWKSLLPFSIAFGSVERDLIELQNRRQRETEKNPHMCPIVRLPEVCCLRDHHLMEWFSTFRVCELHEREHHRKRLFANRDCVHMARLEPELKKIWINWRNQKL